MLSVTFLRLSYVSVICRVTYFQFPIQPVFFQYIGRLARQHQHCSVLLVLLRNIGHRTLPKILGRYLSCAEHTSQGKDFELILRRKISLFHVKVIYLDGCKIAGLGALTYES